MDMCDPDPDFAKLAQSMGWYGEGPIDDPKKVGWWDNLVGPGKRAIVEAPTYDRPLKILSALGPTRETRSCSRPLPSTLRSSAIAGTSFNPNTYGEIKTIADHFHYTGNQGPHAANDAVVSEMQDAEGDRFRFPGDFRGHAGLAQHHPQFSLAR